MVVDDSVTGTISVSFENLTFDQALGYINHEDWADNWVITLW